MLQDSGQAGALEITSAMLTAGIDAFWEFDLDDDGSEIIVRTVFERMINAMAKQTD